MAKYKVGDKVVVMGDGKPAHKYFMEDGKEFNTMVGEMLKYRGKVVTIKSVDRQYRIEECSYGWVDEMFTGLYTPGKFKVGDIVQSNCRVGNTGESGSMGKILEYQTDGMILVEFFNHIDGHAGGGAAKVKGKQGYCWWMHSRELEPVEDPLTETLNPWDANPVNDYSRACWHGQPGGLVDRLAFAAGAILLCPVCGRVCDGREVTR